MGRVGAGRWRRVRAYVAGVLELVERTALFSDSVDWDTVRLDAEEVLGRAGCYADTHTFLAAVVRQAGGRHSRLIPPKSPHASPGQVAAVLGPPVPTGTVMDAAGHPAGYLRLPRLPGGLPRARRYLATGGTLLNTLVAARPRGWIVDLRGNIGGNMWPMLAVAAPLLPDGELGHFVLPDGRHQTWTLERGRIRLDGRRMARSRGPAFREDPVPIAVLTSRRTASAGEAVAVAFSGRPGVRMIGAPTAGFTTGNRTHVLRDGTRLLLTGSHYADRHGRRIDGAVAVDVHVAGGDQDAPLDAALAWIHPSGR